MKKRWMSILMSLLVLCGCSMKNEEFDRAMLLRTSLINGAGCQFLAKITADYGDKTYTFSLSCETDKEGNLNFTVLEPDYIADIKGKITSHGGEITFDDVALGFELQTDDLLSPVSAPWILMRAIRGGYVRSCGKEGEYLRMTVDDSYQEDALMVDIWLNKENQPIWADIYEGNRCILSLEIEGYAIL